MRLDHPFYRFPFRFDVDRLRAEVAAIPEDSWCRHVTNFEGNVHLPLISTDGAINDTFDPPMRPTQFLPRCPYIMQVFARFGTLHGRARLMRLEPGHGVPPHVDINYYWRTHCRVHIPVVTHPEIIFHCGDEAVHMQAGEAWTFDNLRKHKVVNETRTRRIHLTFDTYGSAGFWALATPRGAAGEEEFVAYDPAARPRLDYETYVGDGVMAPAELELELLRFVDDVAAEPANDRQTVARIQTLATTLRQEWRTLWFAKGPTGEALPDFTALHQRMLRDFKAAIPPGVNMASNGWSALDIAVSIFTAMLRPRTAAAAAAQVGAAPSPSAAASRQPRFARPVFIMAAPRSGSTLLFETLARSQALWTVGGEGHAHVEQITALTPFAHDFQSNRLTAVDATAEICARLEANYAAGLRDADGAAYGAMADPPQAVRFLEKTPKNALRIPFFKAVFPDARFIFLHREARANISAIMEAWRSERFITYPRLKDWHGMPWSMLLIPGWRDLNGRDLAEIALRQWRATNETIMNDLAALPRADWCGASYEAFLADPARTLERLCAFSGVPFDAAMREVAGAPLRPSRHTLTAPDPEKWRKNEAAMAPFLDAARPTIARLASFDAQPVPLAAQ